MRENYKYDVYKLAEKLSDMVWNGFDSWPTKVRSTSGYQIIRASDSISANLAEGYGRYSSADKKKFYYYSRGSFEETKAWLRKLYRRKIITEQVMKEYKITIDKLGPKLNGFINSTKIGKR